MIPLSCLEDVRYTDDVDGIVYVFKPKTPLLERELWILWENLKDKSMSDQSDLVDVFLEKIVIGWNDPHKRLPDFPGSGIRSMFNLNEKLELIKFWNKANELSFEQKKSS